MNTPVTIDITRNTVHKSVTITAKLEHDSMDCDGLRKLVFIDVNKQYGKCPFATYDDVTVSFNDISVTGSVATASYINNKITVHILPQ